jgi:hypothetical protein
MTTICVGSCSNTTSTGLHHWDPKAHWTEMKAVHAEIRPQMLANGIRILRGPHITIFLEDWLRRRNYRTDYGLAGSAFHTLMSSNKPSLPATPSSILDLVAWPMPDDLR